MKKFALIGAAGYVAPKHMKAIKETGSDLVAALDPFDSVGILDSYFPNAAFFTEFERFDRHLDKIKRKNQAIDLLSICSPNYMHDAHMRYGLRSGTDVICEKPIVLNPWNLEALKEIEDETGKKVYNILQLRHHPSIIEIKQKIDQEDRNKFHDVDLAYVTSRGKWYHHSWKGDLEKSGGITTNIGVHFYDMLMWIFGGVKKNVVHILEKDRAAGYLELERARVRWFLSVNYDYIPKEIKAKNQRTYRSITVDGQEIEFSKGFTDLHTKSYQAILNNQGFGLNHANPSIQLIHEIRNSDISGITGDYHPMCKGDMATIKN